MATAYWIDHKHEIIAWIIVGLLLVIFLFWCFLSKAAIIGRLPPVPAIAPQTYSGIDDVELAPLPRAFVRMPSSSRMLQLPLYEDRDRDLRVPDSMQLEKRNGYFYPKGLKRLVDVTGDENRR